MQRIFSRRSPARSRSSSDNFLVETASFDRPLRLNPASLVDEEKSSQAANMAAKVSERRVDQRGYKKKRKGSRNSRFAYMLISGALIGDDKQSNYTKRAGSRRCGGR